MTDLHVVILAAGKGTRMKSDVPKVLHRIAGRPLIDRVLTTAAPLAPGHHDARGRPRRRSASASIWHRTRICSSSCRSRSSGPATRCSRRRRSSADAQGTVLLLSGDVPLLTSRDARGPGADASATRAPLATVLTAAVDRPYGYGRIVRYAGQDHAHRRGARRLAGAARDQGDQLRHLRVRARAALRRARADRRPTTRKASITCPI